MQYEIDVFFVVIGRVFVRITADTFVLRRSRGPVMVTYRFECHLWCVRSTVRDVSLRSDHVEDYRC